MNVLLFLTTAAVFAAAVLLVWLIRAQLNDTNAQLRQLTERMASLDQILASPKLRGNLGEWTLEMMLYDVLPHGHVLRRTGCRRAAWWWMLPCGLPTTV